MSDGSVNSEIISTENLTKVYGGGVKAVDQITFKVEEKEIFGFLGPNGAGKTTTIRMLTTLASITSGTAKVAGYDVAKQPAEVRKSIGLVPQELTADDELKGVENLTLLAKLHHVPQSLMNRKVNELLQLFDLQDAAQRRVKTYSGGMRRRLQMAMGLVHSPKVLFLDEPTLGLDIQTRTKVWDYIKELNKSGLTVFMTTHYLEEADSLCDRIGIIDHGVIKVLDSPGRLKEQFGGNVLTLELSESSPDLCEFFTSASGASCVSKEGNVYKIRILRIEDAFPTIVEGVTKRGLKIKGISCPKSSLDEVFLQVTGKTMREGEGSQEVWVQNLNLGRSTT